MKKNLIEDVQGFFDNQSLYKEFSVPWKRGVILHGVPGNGKTVSIKALMNALAERPDEIPSLYVKSFETKCNTAQYSIRSIFTMARSMAPCLLIFEDLDSLVSDDIRSYFLNEVDGLESNDGILMIGSTNHLNKLDPAISKRPSRFDRKYHFKIPSEQERRSYAMYWRNKLLKNDTVEFPEEVADIVALLTEGFSFAYMKELFVMALLPSSEAQKSMMTSKSSKLPPPRSPKLLPPHRPKSVHVRQSARTAINLSQAPPLPKLLRNKMSPRKQIKKPRRTR
jgi:transitional endoplasmic reticulum ATPase